MNSALSSIEVDNEISLELIQFKHVTETFDLIEQNRAYLKEWLTWPDLITSEKLFKNFVTHLRSRIELGTDLPFVIKHNSKIIGRIGLYDIDKQNKRASIGYWISEDFQGKRIVKKCTQKLTETGFELLQLHRIEITCAVGNTKSQTIPQYLNFTYEGIKRGAEYLNGTHVDLHVYAKLHSDPN